jgi:acetylornithine deacetylase
VSNLLSNRDLLARLIGFDSTSQNSNRPIADFICDYLDLPGVTVDWQPSPDEEKVNLIVRVGPRDISDGGGLVLSGHMDTVPADEPEWTTGPYTLAESDGRYFGRGVCDMKGFLALAMNAAATVRNAELQRPLVLIFTYDEEVGILGSKHLAHSYEGRQHLPIAAVVGEPTSLNVVRMHKGFLGFKVVLFGKSAHSGYPHLGNNAIEPAGTLIQTLKQLRCDFESESPPNAEFFPEVPFAALNIGTIFGGAAPNIIPDRCEIACSLRILPGTKSQPVVDRVREIVLASLADSQYEFEVTNESPPLLLETDAKIHRMLAERVGQTDTHSASYATDAGWLQTLGMECAVFGPGNIEVAHRPNESLPLAEFAKCETILEELIQEFCHNTS